jgi:hypothetical protein
MSGMLLHPLQCTGGLHEEDAPLLGVSVVHSREACAVQSLLCFVHWCPLIRRSASILPEEWSEGHTFRPGEGLDGASVLKLRPEAFPWCPSQVGSTDLHPPPSIKIATFPFLIRLHFQATPPLTPHPRMVANRRKLPPKQASPQNKPNKASVGRLNFSPCGQHDFKNTA